MRLRQIDPLFTAIFCSVALACSASAWASTGTCSYETSGAGIGGTGHSGTGMGGTGTTARGSGIGGTGMTQPIEVAEMQVAGNVIQAQGKVEAQSNGRSRLLAEGDAICVGETIVTMGSAAVQLAMADHARIAILPQTELKIEKYVYTGTGKDASRMTLLRGGGRFVTGAIGKAHPENDVIRTPDATIGVRGTDHEARVILPGENSARLAGTYDKVNSGITFIRTEKGEVELHPNQAGYAAGAAETPVLLQAVPDFYRTSPPLGTESLPRQESPDGTHESDLQKSGEHEGSGSGTETSSEAASPGDSHPDRHDAEGPAHPEHPEVPQAPTIPEHPEVPGLPDHPEVPVVPDHPEVPVVPDHPELPGSHDGPELPLQPDT